MRNLLQISKIVLSVILSGWFCPQNSSGQENNNILIIKPQSDIVSKFTDVRDNLQETLYNRFHFDKEIIGELPYETWDLLETDEERIVELNERLVNVIVVPELRVVVDKLQITLTLIELKDGALQTKVEKSKDFLATEADFENYKMWLDDQIADYSAFIETGEQRKDFILVKLKCKNRPQQLISLDIDDDDVEYYSIRIPTMIMNYAETSNQDTVSNKLRNRFKYEFEERMEPSHENVIYGKFRFLSKDTLIIEIEGRLFSNKLKPSTPEKSVDTSSLSKAASQLAENIFNIINENLNESDD